MFTVYNVEDVPSVCLMCTTLKTYLQCVHCVQRWRRTFDVYTVYNVEDVHSMCTLCTTLKTYLRCVPVFDASVLCVCRSSTAIVHPLHWSVEGEEPSVWPCPGDKESRGHINRSHFAMAVGNVLILQGLLHCQFDYSHSLPLDVGMNSFQPGYGYISS